MLIVITVPMANPAAFDADGVGGGVPIPIKGGTAQDQQSEANRKNPNAWVHSREASGRNASWQCSGERGITMRAQPRLGADQFSAALATGESLGFEKEFTDCRKAKPKN